MRTTAWVVLLATACGFARAEDLVYVSLAGERRIALYRTDHHDGTLKLTASILVEGEPGALTTDPARRFLFASYRPEGKIASFVIDPVSRTLTTRSVVTAGADPAYLATDRTGRFLFAAYYVAGKVSVHAITPDGTLSARPRQEVPTAEKAHASVVDPANRFVLVPHTGPNAIYQFAFDSANGTLAPAAVSKLATPLNSGPRHLVFHPSRPMAYFDNELGNSVTVCRFDAKTGNLEPFQTVSTLPADFAGTNACAEIRLHPSGAFLYVSNRGHDSIACFAVSAEDGSLTPRGQVPTERTPRSFDLDPTGRYLYAAGESSGNVAAYHIDLQTGTPQRLAVYEVGKRPWWVMAVALRSEERQ